jgi:hypothetical protein
MWWSVHWRRLAPACRGHSRARTEHEEPAVRLREDLPLWSGEGYTSVEHAESSSSCEYITEC